MPSPLLFLGANGFPSRCYSPILSRLSAIPIEYSSHLVPNKTTNWHPLVKSIISQAEEAARKGGGRRVRAVGHSAGGALLCCAASKRPELFEDLCIVDSPMFCELLRKDICLRVSGGGRWVRGRASLLRQNARFRGFDRPDSQLHCELARGPLCVFFLDPSSILNPLCLFILLLPSSLSLCCSVVRLLCCSVALLLCCSVAPPF